MLQLFPTIFFYYENWLRNFHFLISFRSVWYPNWNNSTAATIHQAHPSYIGQVCRFSHIDRYFKMRRVKRPFFPSNSWNWMTIQNLFFYTLSGLHTEFLFKSAGDKKAIQQLISLFNQGVIPWSQLSHHVKCSESISFAYATVMIWWSSNLDFTDWNASLPEGVNPINVASLVKCYLASLPEPLITFEIYNEIKDAGCSIRGTRNVLKELPNVRYTTLEFITALLLHVSQKSSLNKVIFPSLLACVYSTLHCCIHDMCYKQKYQIHAHLDIYNTLASVCSRC